MIRSIFTQTDARIRIIMRPILTNCEMMRKMPYCALLMITGTNGRIASPVKEKVVFLGSGVSPADDVD